MVATQDIREAVRDLSLSGHPLCIHSSLRSFGWVDGGALAVVYGLLAEGCTIIDGMMRPVYWDLVIVIGMRY